MGRFHQWGYPELSLDGLFLFIQWKILSMAWMMKNRGTPMTMEPPTSRMDCVVVCECWMISYWIFVDQSWASWANSGSIMDRLMVVIPILEYAITPPLDLAPKKHCVRN